MFKNLNRIAKGLYEKQTEEAGAECARTGEEKRLITDTKKPQRLLWLGTSKGNRTPDFALRGQRLNRLTMEADGWGTRIRT